MLTRGSSCPESGAAITSIEVGAYRVPTDAPESDGTLAWDATTLVVVRIQGGGRTGLGYTYADHAAAALVQEKLAPEIIGKDALQTAARTADLRRTVRNLGQQGLAALAISAIDAALWDLKGRLFGAPLVHLLGGAARSAVPVYGSGGFTSYDLATLEGQLAGWVDLGLRWVKMKVGRDPASDESRVQAARAAIGEDTGLFVDANGAYTRKQALAMAERFARHGVTWFEEPVSSDDIAGLRLLRDRAPAPIQVSAGEYGFDLRHFLRLLEAGAVDVLQADATRCLGLTGFMQAAALADAFGIPLSSHCAPALHVAAGCCAQRAIHLEWFHDHVRIESMLFDGAPKPQNGCVAPDPSRPGLGLDFKPADARRYEI